MTPDGLQLDERFFVRIAVKNGFLSADAAEGVARERRELEALGRRKPIWALLLDRGLLSAEQVDRIHAAQTATHALRLDSLYADVLRKRGTISEATLSAAVAEQRAQQGRVRLPEILKSRGAIDEPEHRSVLRELLALVEGEERAYVQALSRKPKLAGGADAPGGMDPRLLTTMAGERAPAMAPPTARESARAPAAAPAPGAGKPPAASRSGRVTLVDTSSSSATHRDDPSTSVTRNEPSTTVTHRQQPSSSQRALLPPPSPPTEPDRAVSPAPKKTSGRQAPVPIEAPAPAEKRRPARSDESLDESRELRWSDSSRDGSGSRDGPPDLSPPTPDWLGGDSIATKPADGALLDSAERVLSELEEGSGSATASSSSSDSAEAPSALEMHAVAEVRKQVRTDLAGRVRRELSGHGRTAPRDIFSMKLAAALGALLALPVAVWIVTQGLASTPLPSRNPVAVEPLAVAQPHRPTRAQVAQALANQVPARPEEPSPSSPSRARPGEPRPVPTTEPTITEAEGEELWQSALRELRDGRTERAVGFLRALIARRPSRRSVDALDFTEALGDMVYVPAGTFLMGSDEPGERYALPQHPAETGAFFIDRTETRNRDYAAYVSSSGAEPPPQWRTTGGTFPPAEADFPVVNVTWDEASRFAAAAGKRLPTEVEWERAARGTDGRRFPWGASLEDAQPNITTMLARSPGLRAAGASSGDVSPCGAVDMAGNASEWTASPFVPYEGGNKRNGDFSDRLKVIRGGSWRNEDGAARCANRDRAAPGQRFPEVGFRCVLDAPEWLAEAPK